MFAETLKEYAEKNGWDLYYSQVEQNWVLHKLGNGATYHINPTFEEVESFIEFERSLVKCQQQN